MKSFMLSAIAAMSLSTVGFSEELAQPETKSDPAAESVKKAEEAPLLVPNGNSQAANASGRDSANHSGSDLQKAADAAAAKMELKPTLFRVSLLDKSAEQKFPNIDCQDGSDLLYRWEAKSADDVTNNHIENAAAFREWYKTQCAHVTASP